MTEAYAMGFCKVANDYGVNPEELYKSASGIGAIFGGAARGARAAGKAGRAGRTAGRTAGRAGANFGIFSKMPSINSILRGSARGYSNPLGSKMLRELGSAGKDIVRGTGRFIRKHPVVSTIGAGAAGAAYGQASGRNAGYQQGATDMAQAITRPAGQRMPSTASQTAAQPQQ